MKYLRVYIDNSADSKHIVAYLRDLDVRFTVVPIYSESNPPFIVQDDLNELHGVDIIKQFLSDMTPEQKEDYFR